MSRVRAKNTAIERNFFNILKKARLNFKKHDNDMLGTPDVIFKRKKVVVFLDSCFWHGCRWHCRMPSTNRDYWTKKIARNKARDKDVAKQYKANGWKAIRIWEHEVQSNPERVVKKIKLSIANSEK